MSRESPHRGWDAGGSLQSLTRHYLGLQYRRPVWLWHLLAWLAGTLTSPSFLLAGGLLLNDARSDHPLFWWSLPAIVALSNAVSIQVVRQAHRRSRFSDRNAIRRRHASLAHACTSGLFLLSGCVSGFLPDMVPALFNTAGLSWPLLADALGCMLLACAFTLLAHPLPGGLHALLAYERFD